ncbi:MAG: hybrid sensor histidine kinase/response regulator [Massilia sp.]|nr:hybrid sensor histidine kinase/response regulator [Massilia sp.]
MRRPITGARSIRYRLVTVVMVTTLSALMISIGTVIGYDLRHYHRALLGDMATQAELLGHMTSAALTFDDRRLAGENLALLRIRPSVRAGAIYRADGALFASYLAPGESGPLPARPGAAGITVAGSDLVLFGRIVENGELLGTVYLRSEYALVQRTLDYLGIAAGVTLLAMLVAWLLMRRLGRGITVPIVAITDIAREVVAMRDYSRRAARIGDGEAAELADSFNAMLTEIEQRTGALENSNREIAREAEQRARAQQEVMRLNQELEERVHERTMQLETSNAELGQAIEAARNANQAKSAFLSSMSHELRTPLNAILGFAQILASDTLPASETQKRDFAGHILRAGRHLLTLINEVLDLAKVESGTLTLSMEPVALESLLLECRHMIEPLAAGRRIRLLFPEHCAHVVMADRTRLKQVVLNLLSNAVKYNREGGALVLDCEPAGAERVRLSVRDTGAGLEPAQLEALFEPFNRLGQENGAEEGTGIGLVVTRRLVEVMGGTIGVSSSVGVGSVFWFELRATEAQALVVAARVPPAAAAPQPAAGSSHLLLYVEDNPANLKLVEEIVRFRPGLRLLSAPDGALGIALARAHLPEIVLMDLNLPGMSGTAAMCALRADPATAAIPVIALTANAMRSDIERGLASGFHSYLTKPIDIDEFNAAIDSTLAWLARRDAAQKAATP